MVLERDQWNTSQLMSQILQNCVGGTPVSWFWANSGVPFDGEKVVRRRLVEFLVFNSISLNKSAMATRFTPLDGPLILQ